MTYHLELTAVVEVVGPGPEDPDQRADLVGTHLFEVMDLLGDLEDDILLDADMSATLSTGDVVITIDVRVDDPVVATQEGIAAIRTAVHAAGGFTPDWPDEKPPSDDIDWGLRYTGHRQRIAEPVAI